LLKGTETNKKIRININQLNLENFEQARNKSKKENRNFTNAEGLTYSIEQSTRKKRRESIDNLSKKKKEISFSDENVKNLLQTFKEDS